MILFKVIEYHRGDTVIKIHLSRLLGERKMNQAELARLTDIRPTTINEYYHELVERVNLEYLDRICEVLDCPIDELLEYLPNQAKRQWKKEK
ncbi:helix-turn-helix domain-containing protein [Eubacterium limosum]|uniref:helix-turn-helix domain-containing protein n=1 Tax=Eubacterium limosum TaxID=1736 RepID=UPI00241CA596|nr:helix-turn-helix transcriptional regulator [Eubacterium limosum]